MAVSLRSEDRCRARRARWGAVAVVAALLAGCAGGGDGEGADDPPAGDDGASSADATSESTSPTTTTDSPTTSTLPEGAVEVPIDDGLVARLPLLEGGGRQIDDNVAFDERFCDGTKAPAVPKSQARATYPISDTDTITVAAYRFSSSEGPVYLAGYAEAVRGCAREAGPSEGLGVPDLFGSAFFLTTERGEAFIALALDDDVLWVLFQESEAGAVEVDPATFDGFLATALG